MHPVTTWLVETDVMAKLGQPVLSLMSRVFLNDHERIIGQLRETGHDLLLCYVLQQVAQFRNMGKEFAMQHAGTEYLDEKDIREVGKDPRLEFTGFSETNVIENVALTNVVINDKPLNPAEIKSNAFVRNVKILP